MSQRKMWETKRHGRVTTIRRASEDHDGCWMAYIEDDRTQWEAGNTEQEAIGKLIISHPELLK